MTNSNGAPFHRNWCPPSPQSDPSSLPSSPCPRKNHQSLGLVSFKGDPMHICQSNSARWVVVENQPQLCKLHPADLPAPSLPACLRHITPSSLLTQSVLLHRPFPLFYETLVLPQGHSLPCWHSLIEERGRELKCGMQAQLLRKWPLAALMSPRGVTLPIPAFRKFTHCC